MIKSSQEPENPDLMRQNPSSSPTADASPEAPAPQAGRAAASPESPGRALRVLQISHDLRAGGLQRVVIDLAQGLRRLGHDAHICSLRGPGPLEEEIRGRGIPLWTMPWPEKGVDRLLFLKVLNLLRRHRFDVVHTHNTQAFLDGGLAALLARVPVRVHTDHARPFPDKFRYMAMERLMSLGYRKVVGVSDHTAENLRRYEGISPDRLAVVLNGIDGAWYRAERDRIDGAEARRRAGLDGFRRVFGLGVRLEEQKGIRFLLEAMPAVLAGHPDIGLAVAGSGSLESSLKDQARALGIAGNVRFLGPYPELRSFYPLLDYFVLPSLWEGLPLCLLEAMSLGLPIIATRVGGVAGLLEQGRDGELVPAGDPAALASAMIGFLEDPARAESLGRQGRLAFDAHHDSSVMVERYLELYGSGPAPGNGETR